jgi:hypothetical protein
MLVLLPGFFALGFCIGYFLPSWRVREAQRRPTGDGHSSYFLDLVFFTFVAFSVALLAIVTLTVLTTPRVVSFFGPSHFPTPQTWTGYLLGISGIVVGAMGGSWFKNEDANRDKIIFVAASGIVLFLAALEYDHKLFGNLSKIGGNEFSVEFSDKGRGPAADVRSVVSSSTGYLGKVFQGNSGLKLAIGTMKDLPDSIVIDNYYANLFSEGFISNEHAIPVWSNSMQYLYSYLCANVEPFAAKLLLLPPSSEGEISLLGLNPELIMELQNLYFGVGRNYVLNYETLKKAVETFTNEGKVTEDEIDSKFESEKSLKDKFDSSERLGACKSDGIKQITIDSVPPKFIFNAKDQDFEFSAYLALMLSLVEFASGARETAIQVLEEKIQSELGPLGTPPSSYNDDPALCPLPKNDKNATSCVSIQKSKSDFIRKLVILARLEFTENVMMDYLPGNSADLAKVKRWIGASNRYEQALIYFDQFGKFRKSLAIVSAEIPKSAPCVPELRRRGDAVAYLYGRFAFADITTMNNALNLVGNNPSLLQGQPTLTQILDDYAEEVSKLDVECIDLLIRTSTATDRKLILPPLEIHKSQVRSLFLESAGSYWEAKGVSVGSSDATAAQFTSAIRILSLCKARDTYELALQFARDARQDTSFKSPSSNSDYRSGDVQSEVQNDDLFARPSRILAAISRVEQTLGSYPAADVSSACH